MNKFLSISLMIFLLLSCSKTSKFEGDWFNEFGKKELIITKDGSKYIVKRYLPLRNEEIFIGTQDKDGLTINDGNQIKLYLLEDKLIYDGKQLTKNFTETDFATLFSKKWYNNKTLNEFEQSFIMDFDNQGNLHIINKKFISYHGVITTFLDSVINYNDIRIGNQEFFVDNVKLINGEVGEFYVNLRCYIGAVTSKPLSFNISENGRTIYSVNFDQFESIERKYNVDVSIESGKSPCILVDIIKADDTYFLTVDYTQIIGYDEISDGPIFSNTNPKLRTFKVDNTTRIIRLSGIVEHLVDLRNANFKELIEYPMWHIEVNNGIVKSLKQQYYP